ncbi:hypothetical protein BH10BAC1_BH10BAC1_19540 [soil metagenome]
MKQKYDSSVVYLYSTGNENFLPKEFRQQIPYTTIANWRKTDYSAYIGNEFRYFFDEAFESAELKYKHRHIKRLMTSFARSWITLSSVLKPVLRKTKNDKVLQKKILDSIEYIKKYLGLEKTLKLIGITPVMYRQWVLEAAFACVDSHASLCVKRHPHQLGAKEIRKIKRMLLDPKLKHWPIVSIASMALRKKRVIASLYSWYKYAKLLGLNKRTLKIDQKKVGMKANYPNEYLHSDLTELYVGGKKAYICFIMDNYSRMILGFNVGERKTFETVKVAFRKAIDVIITHPDHGHSYYVTDGGRENHNKDIHKFIRELSAHKITKICALKDVTFSNSPVEAINKTMKSRYLRGKHFETINELAIFLEWAVYDYNQIRPHYALAPKTPYEVYFNLKLGFNLVNRRKKAVQDRIKNNLNAKCKECKGSRKGDCGDKCTVTKKGC